MKLKHMFLALALIQSGNLLAHGEDKPGPHGGAIRMPGAFHTEVVQINSSNIRVYLLDMKFQKPIVQNSTLEVKFIGNQITKGVCEREKVSYLCEFKDADLSSKGEIVVNAMRDNQRGVPIGYHTPLERNGL